ncbi:hypothetical protein [Streptomyces sp. NPDC018610]|uniref:hypothetical protein n=1 Tax=Streptomyces sp. NPDC018610 TaxID=3365049 RepID=UPI00379C19C1
MRNIALRAVTLSPESVDTISDIIDVLALLARREHGREQGRAPGREQGGDRTGARK